ncbi:MAG: gamma-glutamylcyclotransferase [Nitrococcus sp.]|nr:gamma-glutamylcyclotransferase [Nitrococcus sp.]
MTLLLYFAYGSNMSTPRLVHRVPSAKCVAVARLEKHQLKFHKRSKDGSAKCDIEHTNNPNDVVYGVVFEILAPEKKALDRKEGLWNGYDEKSVAVLTGNDRLLIAVTYYATDIDASMKLYGWYKEHVLRGAKEHELPVEYIKSIEAVESIADPDQKRDEEELSIYC